MSSPGISLANPRGRRTKLVPPMMAGAVVVLLAGLWVGLQYLGLPMPAGRPQMTASHGPLMALGFLGTLIAVERAVALGSAWAYVGPAGAALGGLAVIAGVPLDVGPALITLGGIVLVGVFVAVHRIQPSFHNVVLASGAAAWVVAGVLWTIGWDIPRFVPWLVGFLVLTIAGERLELSRLTGASGAARVTFGATGGVFVAGLVISLAAEDVGVRVAGVGLLCLGGWLVRNDVARRTVRRSGVTRYMAVALLAGYLWLVAAGVLWLVVGRMTDGPAYDAMLHAVFLGFVISMVFAHAPVIIPAVLGRPLPYSPALYIPLVLLHATLLLRLVGGDAAGDRTAWQWGGALNEVALLLFMVQAAWAVRHAAPTARRTAGAAGGTTAGGTPAGGTTGAVTGAGAGAVGGRG